MPVETSRVLADEELVREPGGCRIAVRLPWYRSLPLSTVDLESVAIDGRMIDRSQLQFELNGARWPPDELQDLMETVWFVLDTAYVHVQGIEMPSGSRHEVAVTLTLFPPYISGLRRPMTERKMLNVR